MNKYLNSMLNKRVKDENKSNECIKHLLGMELDKKECEQIFYEFANRMINYE